MMTPSHHIPITTLIILVTLNDLGDGLFFGKGHGQGHQWSARHRRPYYSRHDGRYSDYTARAYRPYWDSNPRRSDLTGSPGWQSYNGDHPGNSGTHQGWRRNGAARRREQNFYRYSSSDESHHQIYHPQLVTSSSRHHNMNRHHHQQTDRTVIAGYQDPVPPSQRRVDHSGPPSDHLPSPSFTTRLPSTTTLTIPQPTVVVTDGVDGRAPAALPVGSASGREQNVIVVQPSTVVGTVGEESARAEAKTERSFESAPTEDRMTEKQREYMKSVELLLMVATHFDQRGCFVRLVCECEYYLTEQGPLTDEEKLLIHMFGMRRSSVPRSIDSLMEPYRRAAQIGEAARKEEQPDPCAPLAPGCTENMILKLREREARNLLS